MTHRRQTHRPRAVRTRYAALTVCSIAAIALATMGSLVVGMSQAEAAPGKPVVSGIGPDTGSTSGGTVVTIHGTGLGHATLVRFGPRTATSVVVNSSTTITATSPSESAGSVDIRVVTPSGWSVPNPADEFTYVAEPPATVQITPQFADRNCAGDQDVASWVPPAGATGLTGYQVVLEQITDEGPTIQDFNESPDVSTLPFSAVNGENEVLVFEVTSDGVAQDPFGGDELTGFGIPEPMQWEFSGNSVSDGAATVSYSWPGPPQSSVTGGDVAADVVAVTDSPDGGTEELPASLSGESFPFAGLTDGVGYTFTDTVSNMCGTSSPSGVSPVFTPGVVPSITGTPPDAVVGTPYSFAFDLSGNPAPDLAVSDGMLPPGLSINQDGTITGTPTQSGTYEATITAQNAVGIAPFSSGQSSVSFSMSADAPPAITSDPTTTFDTGEAGTFTVSSTGFPAPELTEAGALPSGVVFDIAAGGTATISGTPAAGTAGTYPITISASNGVGPAAVQQFVLEVAPAITSPANTTTLAGVPFSFTVTTAGSPVESITEQGALPKGLHFADNGDGTATISGTPGAKSGGSYTLTITARFGSGAGAQSVAQQLTLVVDRPLSITSPSWVKTPVGHRFNFEVTTIGFPGASSITESGVLPTGMTFNYSGGSTATISGKADRGTQAVYSVTIQATNSSGGVATQTLVLVVKS